MTWFKFIPYERFKSLQGGLVRFTQPGAFNDPFEMPAFKAAEAEAMRLAGLAGLTAQTNEIMQGLTAGHIPQAAFRLPITYWFCTRRAAATRSGPVRGGDRTGSADRRYIRDPLAQRGCRQSPALGSLRCGAPRAGGRGRRRRSGVPRPGPKRWPVSAGPRGRVLGGAATDSRDRGDPVPALLRQEPGMGVRAGVSDRPQARIERPDDRGEAASDPSVPVAADHHPPCRLRRARPRSSATSSVVGDAFRRMLRSCRICRSGPRSTQLPGRYPRGRGACSGQASLSIPRQRFLRPGPMTSPAIVYQSWIAADPRDTLERTGGAR